MTVLFCLSVKSFVRFFLPRFQSAAALPVHEGGARMEGEGRRTLLPLWASMSTTTGIRLNAGTDADRRSIHARTVHTPRTKRSWRWPKGRACAHHRRQGFWGAVFLRGFAHPSGVGLCRMTAAERVDAIRALVERHAQSMREGAIIVVFIRVRVRLQKSPRAQGE